MAPETVEGFCEVGEWAYYEGVEAYGHADGDDAFLRAAQRGVDIATKLVEKIAECGHVLLERPRLSLASPSYSSGSSQPTLVAMAKCGKPLIPGDETSQPGT